MDIGFLVTKVVAPINNILPSYKVMLKHNCNHNNSFLHSIEFRVNNWIMNVAAVTTYWYRCNLYMTQHHKPCPAHGQTTSHHKLSWIILSPPSELCCSQLYVTVNRSLCLFKTLGIPPLRVQRKLKYLDGKEIAKMLLLLWVTATGEQLPAAFDNIII